MTSEGTALKVKELNRWLTEHNQYNTTADLTTIGNEPHECLAALEGRIAQEGPVCDGYARAMKVLCDKLDIPCVLVTGWARTTQTSEPEFHMWNDIQVGGQWYAADITWDDPTVKGFVGAKSGRENENFLLVGANTVVQSMAFSASHVVKNQAAVGGVDFNCGPAISAIALGEPLSGQEAAFSDVPAGHWAEQAIAWAVSKGITVGTGPDTFSPTVTCNHDTILTFLWRAAGSPASAAVLGFTPQLDWAADALRWAKEKGVTDSAYTAAEEKQDCTRAEAVQFIWRAMGSPKTAYDGRFADVPAGSPYAQAIAWAVANQVTVGTSENTFSPDKVCNRAAIVTFLYRAYQR